MGRAGPPDFSSKTYWEHRFEKESEFEWLARSDVILPLVLRLVEEVRSATDRRASDLHVHASHDAPIDAHVNSRSDKAFRVLHFGCGSSNLGSEIHQHLSENSIPAEVIDADYVPTTALSTRSVPLIQLDVLDASSIAQTTKEDGLWDLLVDKSTADAISCGPSIPRLCTSNSNTPSSVALDSGCQDGPLLPPIEVLCDNLARATRPGGRWISISYSASRFDHLLGHSSTEARNSHSWRIVEKVSLGSTSLPEGRVVVDGKGNSRTVYEPETPTWAYILERT